LPEQQQVKPETNQGIKAGNHRPFSFSDLFSIRVSHFYFIIGIADNYKSMASTGIVLHA
jgi:hypothetical protein